MKSIPNLQFAIKHNAGDALGHTTASLLKLTLTQSPQGGFDFATMRGRGRVADVLDKLPADASTIEFEDSDFATARQCAEAYRWGAHHPDLLKFADLFGL